MIKVLLLIKRKKNWHGLQKHFRKSQKQSSKFLQQNPSFIFIQESVYRLSMGNEIHNTVPFPDFVWKRRFIQMQSTFLVSPIQSCDPEKSIDTKQCTASPIYKTFYSMT